MSVGGILSKTLDSNTIGCVIESVSLATARLICQWLSGSFEVLKSKERKAWNASERRKYASSTEFRSAMQKEKTQESFSASEKRVCSFEKSYSCSPKYESQVTDYGGQRKKSSTCSGTLSKSW